jgi:hypothetical protein
MKMTKITPILVVDEIEPSLRLWVDRLGMQKVVEVPEGDRLGFVILAGDGLELMLQTRESIEKEVERDGLPAAMKPAQGRSTLYIESSTSTICARKWRASTSLFQIVRHPTARGNCGSGSRAAT